MNNSNLEQLYRTVIMDHFKNPRNKGLLGFNGYHKVHLNNPSCGDDMNVEIKIENKKIIDIRHDGHGCSICCSSASVMSETLKEKTIKEAEVIIKDFYTLVTGQEVTNEDELGEALAYVGVSQFPARVKCATLSWKAIEKAIEEVTTNE